MNGRWRIDNLVLDIFDCQLQVCGRIVWIGDPSGFTVKVTELSGKSGKVVATIETGAIGKGAIDVGGGFVWVSTHDVPIVQIDPRTNSVRGKFKTKMNEYSAIRFGGGFLWISEGSVRRIKPQE
jgi:hypothetical protein